MSSMQRIHSSSMRISFLRRGETKRFYFLPIQRGYFNDISKKVQFVIFRYRGKSERVRSEFNLLNQKKIHAIRIFFCHSNGRSGLEKIQSYSQIRLEFFWLNLVNFKKNIKTYCNKSFKRREIFQFAVYLSCSFIQLNIKVNIIFTIFNTL